MGSELVEQLSKKLKEKISIFPTWDGRQSDDLEMEYDVHHKLGYTYPMSIIEDSLKYEEDEDESPEGKLFKVAKNVIKEMNSEIKRRASTALQRADAAGIKNISQIPEKFIERMAGDIIRANKINCVIVVPDLWFPRGS